MASKEELKTDILARAPIAGVEITEETIDGMDHKERSAVLKDINATITANEQAANAADPSYTVAEGRTLVSLRGLEKTGVTVKAEHFAGGEETIADLLNKQYIK